MAKPLVFRYGQNELAFHLAKVERSKLYGYKELEVLDEQGGRCELATLADDGRTVVGKGGTGLGCLTADGLWCDRAQLKPVDLEGHEITPVPSSFEAPVPLVERVSEDDYLEHNIRAVYVLKAEGDGSGLVQELQAGTIFKFPYSYRGGLEPDVGFLLCGEDGHVFLTVGNPVKSDYIGLQQITYTEEEEGEAEEEEADLMDFDMI